MAVDPFANGRHLVAQQQPPTHQNQDYAQRKICTILSHTISPLQDSIRPFHQKVSKIALILGFIRHNFFGTLIHADKR